MNAPPEDRRIGRGLILDEAARAVVLNGEPMVLTRSEYALLTALAARPNQAMAARELLETMWGSRWDADTTPLQTHVSRLRSKLGESAAEPRHIVTVHGFGYRFEPDPVVLTSDEVVEDHWAVEHTVAEGEQQPLVYALFAPDRACLWIGPPVEQLLGWPPSDFVGTTVYDWAHPDDGISMRDMRPMLDSGHPAAIIIWLRTAAGGYRLVEALIRPVVGSDAAVNAFLAEWKPAPDRPGADPEERIPATPDDAAAHQAGTVELAFDRELTLTEVHPHAPFLGYDPDDIIGTGFSPTGITRSVLLGVVGALVSAGTLTIDGMVDMFTAGGEPIRVHVAQELTVDGDREFTGMRSVLHLPS